MHRNPSVMSHQFSQVPQAQLPRSTFNRSHGYKTTLAEAGVLYPIYFDEGMPGDTFSCNMTGFARLATPIYPIMDNMFMDTQFFAVPIRLLWDNWEKFNGAQTNPGDSTDFIVPQMGPGIGGYVSGSLEDYFGLPLGVEGFGHSALFHRAYTLIWNEWYRSQDLQDTVEVRTNDGPDDSAWYGLRRRGKRYDYFTGCLPWPQKGPGVALPLGVSAPVVPTGDAIPTFNSVSDGVRVLNTFTGQPFVHLGANATGTGAMSWNNANLVADLSTASAATINSLRQAFQIQKIYERDARGGTRYVEHLWNHWKVRSPDFRVQRPEFLGGGSSMVNISPIPQTSATGAYAESPQGNLAAMGTALLKGHGFTTSFTEHCIVIGLLSVRADLTYQQGLDRMWSRRTRFDFPLPALMHLGEQAVFSRELYCDGTVGDNEVFGYQERFSEMRFKRSLITGKFRSSDPQSLDAWHLSQDFTTRPVLDSAFIEERPPVSRVIAVPSEPHFLFDAYFNLKCARPMPVYGDPGYIDHF